MGSTDCPSGSVRRCGSSSSPGCCSSRSSSPWARLVFRRYRLAIASLAFIPLKLLIEKGVVKNLVERERPATTICHLDLSCGHFRDVPLESLSFVSGHAIISWGVATLLYPYLPGRWRWLPFPDRDAQRDRTRLPRRAQPARCDRRRRDRRGARRPAHDGDRIAGAGAYANTCNEYAVMNPSVVTTPTTGPPCSYASGIIVSASIVRIAPPAKLCTNATVSGDAVSSKP